MSQSIFNSTYVQAVEEVKVRPLRFFFFFFVGRFGLKKFAQNSSDLVPDTQRCEPSAETADRYSDVSTPTKMCQHPAGKCHKI